MDNKIVKKMDGILGLGDIVDSLGITNIKISLLEGMIKNKKIDNEKRGKVSFHIRTLNKKRNSYKEVLNKWSGGGFEDIKIEDLGLLEEPK